ncbi:PREDICTED: DDT domain-containing protein DDR4 isoform X2 [Ipomoea nil]|uniref:DDT domain-containing protein DDR4 isoform X2 n=1 Tax=Ipomoea nil TaxID=35883 RepID=UPI000901F7C1|nr:PREDICTED: DDT domain-containing protein DDR4 isoform X2 [Ipomoea nil]
MVDRGRRPTVASGNGNEDHPEVISDSPATDSELARLQLRQRWELASILNFLNVFEPVLGIDFKISAEEIETGLIEPNRSLAQLHVALLKGIPPISKLLKQSDGWVTVLCKKLIVWWPWVAEGDFPLSPAKGEEICTYKAVNPIIRLLLLKALCEIRADQGDVLSYINDSIKNGTALSTFRKDKLGGDGVGISYWYDGNEIIGHRGMENGLAIGSRWETLATNLEEFRTFVDNVSYSEVKWENAVGKAVQADVIPVLEKIQKKKDRALKRKRSQDTVLYSFRPSAVTRSCRNRGHINYTFDDYDRAINEAIEVTNNKRTTKEQSHTKQNSEHGTVNGTVDDHEDSLATSSTGDESTRSDTESEQHPGSDVADDTSDENDGEKVADAREEDTITKHDYPTEESWLENGDRDPHCSKRGYILRRTNRSAKDRSIQRPILTTAECVVVPDSEDEE